MKKITLFEMAFLSMFALKSMGFDSNNLFYNFFMIFASVSMIIDYLHKRKYKNRELLYAIVLILISIVVTIFSNQFAILATVVTLVCCKTVNVQKLQKRMLFVQGVVFFGMLFLSFTGVIENKMVTMAKGLDMVTGYTLGYSHPNLAGLQSFILVLLILLNKRSIFTYGLCLAISISIYYFTRSRTSFYFCILAIILFAILTWMVKNNKAQKVINKMKILLISMPPFLSLLSFVSVFLYRRNNSLVRSINILIGGRLQLGSQFLDQYPLNLFGQMTEQYSNEATYFRLDSGYLNVFVRFGIVISLIFILSYCLCINKLILRKRYYECCIVALFLIYGLIETYIYNVFINFSLLYIPWMLYWGKDTQGR